MAFTNQCRQQKGAMIERFIRSFFGQNLVFTLDIGAFFVVSHTFCGTGPTPQRRSAAL